MRKLRPLAIVIGALVATAGLMAPAFAHSGNKLQLWLSDLRVQHTDTGYTVTATLTDRDSGSRAVGYATTLEGTNASGTPFGPVALQAGPGGRYTGTVPGEPGDWNVTLKATEVPGTEPAIPLVVTKKVPFPAAAGQVAKVSTPGATDDDGGGGSAGAVVAIVLVIAAAAIGAFFFAQRRRSRLAGAVR